MIVGALSLDGSILPVPGTLSMAKCAVQHGLRGIIVPWENVQEASLVDGIEVYGAKHLSQITSFLMGGTWLKPEKPNKIRRLNQQNTEVDLSQIRGQMAAKRVLEISSVGNHHMLMIVPPGVGKTLLAKSITGILPKMSDQEIQEVTQVYSSRLDQDFGIPHYQRPFRQPHHHCTNAGILGGGNRLSPGEASLAHRGVLYLDEVVEFKKSVLEGFRQPLESQKIILARGSYHLELPAPFTLIASMNPSPFNSIKEIEPNKPVHWEEHRDKSYRNKISKPLLDLIPLQIDIPKLSQEDLLEAPIGPSSSVVLACIEKSCQFRKTRIAQVGNQHTTWWQNVENNREIKSFWVHYMTQKNYSVRTQAMLYEVSRTIADLEQQEHVSLDHIFEALQYRSLDGYFA